MHMLDTTPLVSRIVASRLGICLRGVQLSLVCLGVAGACGVAAAEDVPSNLQGSFDSHPPSERAGESTGANARGYTWGAAVEHYHDHWAARFGRFVGPKAWVANGLSSQHRDYLRRGGFGFFIGDGSLNYRVEQMTEVYYNVAFRGLWLGLDYQNVENPGYNADRGRVDFFGVRTHLDL
jgi:hypothetical protein